MEVESIILYSVSAILALLAPILIAKLTEHYRGNGNKVKFIASLHEMNKSIRNSMNDLESITSLNFAYTPELKKYLPKGLLLFPYIIFIILVFLILYILELKVVALYPVFIYYPMTYMFYFYLSLLGISSNSEGYFKITRDNLWRVYLTIKISSVLLASTLISLLASYLIWVDISTLGAYLALIFITLIGFTINTAGIINIRSAIWYDLLIKEYQIGFPKVKICFNNKEE